MGDVTYNQDNIVNAVYFMQRVLFTLFDARVWNRISAPNNGNISSKTCSTLSPIHDASWCGDSVYSGDMST